MGAPPAPAPIQAAAPLRFTAVERDFAVQVAAKGLYEVEVSRLAASRAQNPSVRNFAQSLVVLHSRLNGELSMLMSARGVVPPHTLAADKAAKLQRLGALPPSDAFDNGFIRVVGIEEHQETIAAMEKAKAEVNDADLRAWIERTLPILRSHLSEAQSIAGTLVG